MNNFSTVDVTGSEMDEYFDDEVAGMLKHYGLFAYHNDACNFYDGYRFGSRLVYNPWSIMQFVADAIDSVREEEPIRFRCERLSSSGKDIVKRLLREATRDSLFFDAVERLENGEEDNVEVIDQLTFHDMCGTHKDLWAILLHAW